MTRPVRRQSSRRSTIVSLDEINVQEQLAEMLRYEQEMRDHAFALNLQREEGNEQDDADAVPVPIPIPVQRNDADVVTIPPPIPAVASPAPAPRPVQQAAPSNSRRSGRISPPGRQAAGRSANANDVGTRDAPGPIRMSQSTRALVRQMQRTAPPNARAILARIADVSSSSDDSDGDVLLVDSADSSISSVSSGSSNSSNSSGSSSSSDDSSRIRVQNSTSPIGSSSDSSSSSDDEPTSRARIQAANTLNGLRRTQSDVHATRSHSHSVVGVLVSGDNSNQPSTSRGPVTPVRSGVLDPTWGDCTMCFEVPIKPQGCNRCRQIIGCATCVASWFKAAHREAACPLCRNKWARKPDVSPMTTIENRRRSIRPVARRGARA
ncbi:hypothetical protein B9Z55_001350 [Caenorhabditis nigoni]|uniref:RING-type domain-containing protein n=1 Tax=Caenorhabditis nigoni TaxID=1611254 RepID=A0A2G5VFE3_9PELO|nr:hypothetical protein B9Z55_001350 [Caenorhabditis nigoni]